MDGLVYFYKLNWLTIFGDRESPGGFDAAVQPILDQGKKVFMDLKFHDVGATIRSYIEYIAERGVSFATVYGHPEVIEAAREASAGSDLKILSVTLLTSHQKPLIQDLYDLREGLPDDVGDYVLQRARRLLGWGCDGVVTSAREVRVLRKELEGDYGQVLIVSPGIREEDDARDDHARFGTSREAIGAGADYIVVGRPIYTAKDPRAAATKYLEGIRAGLADRGA